MSVSVPLHGHPLATDFYQFTMAYAYWKTKKYDQEAVFHLYFRENPFHGGYTVAAGIDTVLDYVTNYRFDPQAMAFLAKQQTATGDAMFEPAFLDYLKTLVFSCDVDAVEEGSLVFPYEPLLRVKGPILQCQLLETPLLNLLNFQTLVATKASRIVQAAGGDRVLEFGMRRAHGIEASVWASRAAFIGGVHATSNVLAASLFDIPLSGTHAHSWVMAFDTEKEAFARYAETMPHQCVLLVDTYDTIQGLKHAIEIALHMRTQGKELQGIRLDSGDLAYLSILARRMLDEAGLQEVVLIASGDLDEHIVESLKQQGACISVWGVGTHLTTAYHQPSLGGVFKVSAIKKGGKWSPTIKISDSSSKINIPGIQQVRRFVRNKKFVADMIYEEETTSSASSLSPYTMISLIDPTKRKKLPLDDTESYTLLSPALRKGKRCALPSPSPSLKPFQERHLRELAALDKTIKRFVNPHRYPVGVEASLYEKRMRMIMQAKAS